MNTAYLEVASTETAKVARLALNAYKANQEDKLSTEKHGWVYDTPTGEILSTEKLARFKARLNTTASAMLTQFPYSTPTTGTSEKGDEQ